MRYETVSDLAFQELLIIMELPIGMKTLPTAYGFDDVAIVPGSETINPDLADVSMSFNGLSMQIPFLASAMDSVVDAGFAVKMSDAGGLAIMNMDGLHTRYDDTASIYQDIAHATKDDATELLQKIYSSPVNPELVGQRVEEIKDAGGRAAVSFVPQTAKRHAPLAAEAGADLIVVQGTVITSRHRSTNSPVGLVLSDLVQQVDVPVVVGNTVSYTVTRELLEEGVDGILVGVGPGSACTSREVLGIGVPQVSATLECAAARDAYYKDTGRYVPIVTDGGIRTGGDVCKSVASGADAVMIGSPFAKTEEAPAKGMHWGMATWHDSLPRGTRIDLGVKYGLRELLFGPSSTPDGTLNLVGALKVCMGYVGAETLLEMHDARMVYAPAIKTEGKIYQLSGA